MLFLHDPGVFYRFLIIFRRVYCTVRLAIFTLRLSLHPNKNMSLKTYT